MTSGVLTTVGLYAASVPVVNAVGVTLAALTTCIPVSRVSPERREAILTVLQSAGRTLSELASWIPAFSARRA